MTAAAPAFPLPPERREYVPERPAPRRGPSGATTAKDEPSAAPVAPVPAAAGLPPPASPPVRYVLREGLVGDRPFVLDSWLNSYRAGSAFARPVRASIVMQRHRAVALRILDRPTARLVVATLPDSPRVILGWLVAEPGPGTLGVAPGTAELPALLHYVYVKEAWRRTGIAHALLRVLAPQWAYSHRVTAVEEALRKLPQAVYDPYLAWEGA